MPTDPTGSEELLVQGLAEKGVGETKMERGAETATFLDDCSRVCLLQRFEYDLFAQTRNALEYVETELLTDYRGDMQDFISAFAEATQALSDDVAQAFGHIG